MRLHFNWKGVGLDRMEKRQHHGNLWREPAGNPIRTTSWPKVCGGNPLGSRILGRPLWPLLYIEGSKLDPPLGSAGSSRIDF